MDEAGGAWICDFPGASDGAMLGSGSWNDGHRRAPLGWMGGRGPRLVIYIAEWSSEGTWLFIAAEPLVLV